MNPLIRKIISLSLLLACYLPLSSQELSKKEFIKAVQNADISFYYDEDFSKAANLYKSLLNIYPDNLNLSAKLGICYLNLDGKKDEAIRLLNKASKNIVSSDKDYTEFGEHAPLDTYLYLAIAYHQNDSLEKALTLYSEAKKIIGSDELFRIDFIDLMIRDCKYALEMKKKPLSLIENLFVPWLVDYPGAINPVVSKNDSVFVFTQNTDGKTKILCSYKSDKWEKPSDITKQLGGYDRFYSNSITGDGRLLIIYLDDGGDGNLYYSIRTGSTWSRIKSLGKNINTIYWEAHGSITPDGRKLFFSSNRPNGEGELDIWYSERDEKGVWKSPENCGDIINTPFNENTPFLDTGTNALLFSSIGHISMGGYDLFRSVNRNGVWTNPVGMPYPFNTTSDNQFFIVNNNGPGFVTSLYKNETNSRNIYTIVAEDPSEKITYVKGIIALQDGLKPIPEKTVIKLFNNKMEEIQGSVPLLDSTSYNLELKPGDYNIFISHTDYITDTIHLNIPLYLQNNYISLNTSLTPEKVLSGNYLSIKNVLFDFDSFTLNKEALLSLGNLLAILERYPELNITVEGYTDAIGSTTYNKKLAERRAQTVIDYLSESGISSSRFIKKVYGESSFVAINANADGTDNPEGRKYNRRVTFGIIDPHTGVAISRETYTPEHLRQPYSIKYCIILKKSPAILPNNYFNEIDMSDIQYITPLKIDSIYLYSIGLFYNRFDAQKYLGYLKGIGFKDAYIVTQYEINNRSISLFNSDPLTRNIGEEPIYTIQLKAARKAIPLARFSGIEDVTEIKSSDGYYRYIWGKFDSYTEAKRAIRPFLNSEYKDAFIRELSLVRDY